MANAVSLQPGMIHSNELGYYKEGGYGLRIENLVVVTESERRPDFLEIETLTLARIDRRLINIELLWAPETVWVDNYHRHIYETLQTFVSDNVRCWLKQATQPLNTN